MPLLSKAAKPVLIPPMSLLKEGDFILSEQDLAEEIKAYIHEVNALIEAFNAAEEQDTKEKILRSIHKRSQEMDNNYPEDFFDRSPLYRAGQAGLYQQLIQQAQPLKIASFAKENKPANTLAGIIANMSPEKADALLRQLILCSKDKKRGDVVDKKVLEQIYGTEKTQEAKQFKEYCKTHRFSILSVGNSINFLVKDAKGNNPQVLKVGYYLNAPRNAEVHLRNRPYLEDRFTTIEAERQVTCDLGEPVSRTLIVTDYCPQGSIVDQRKKIKEDGEVAQNMKKIFPQMANALLRLGNSGCMFPDCKLSNWLLNEKGTLIIADTKALVFTDKEGNYSANLPGNRWHGWMTTSGFETDSQHVDRTHACILGRNLYAYATNIVGKGFDTTHYDFNLPIFYSLYGQRIEHLIKKLITVSPKDRLSMREAMDELFSIYHPEFDSILHQLRSLKFGSKDFFMQEYILDQQSKILQAASQEEKDTIRSEMEQTVCGLAQNQELQAISKIIDGFKGHSARYTVGYLAKAERITQAMSDISIEDRINFNSTNHPSVLKALASHRHWGKADRHLDKTGAIIEKNAAATYTDFKKFKEKLAHPVDEKPEEPPSKEAPSA